MRGVRRSRLATGGTEEVDEVDDVGDVDDDMLRYFDGFAFDGALVVATGTTAWMLLTNGSD